MLFHAKFGFLEATFTFLTPLNYLSSLKWLLSNPWLITPSVRTMETAVPI